MIAGSMFKSARCPFYSNDGEKSIYCRDAMSDSALSVFFESKSEVYAKHYCCSNWTDCTIARMLWAKYDDVANMDKFTGIHPIRRAKPVPASDDT